jgi:hypothetical protein
LKIKNKIKLEQKQTNAVNNSLEKQVSNLKKSYMTLASQGGTGIVGGIMSETGLGRRISERLSPELAKAQNTFKTSRDALVLQIQHAYTGAQVSDKERQFYMTLIGDAINTPEAFNAKLDGILSMVRAKQDAYNEAIQSYMIETGEEPTAEVRNQLVNQIQPDISYLEESQKGKIQRATELSPQSVFNVKGDEPQEVQQWPGAPAVGSIVEGYMYKGGDPNKLESWEKQ